VIGLERPQPAVRVAARQDEGGGGALAALLERLAQLVAGRPALAGIAREAAIDRGGEPGVARRSAEPGRIAALHHLREVARRDVVERGLSAEQLVQHRAERIDVAPPVRGDSSPQLGSHVVRGTRDRAGLAAGRRGVGEGREPEVQQLGGAVLGDDRVAGLDVPVDHPAPVGGRKPSGQLDPEPEDSIRRHREG
jgi:hypothetical protein